MARRPKVLNTLLVPIVASRVAGALGLIGPAFRFVVARALMRRGERAFTGYRPTEHDVFVATFAKSGTNWAMQLCVQIAHRGAAEFDHIHDVVAWPDMTLPRIVALDDAGPRLRSPTGLRVIKTHLSADKVPYSPAARYVTFIRDPKEVAVSAYHFVLGMLGVRHRVSPREWVDLWTDRGLLGSAWAEHTASFWALRERPNVLVRTFNQVKGDLGGTIAALAEHMGVELTPEELSAVIERGSFPYMRAHEEQFAPPQLPLSRPDQHPRMIRRGESGRSDELLSVDERRRIDAFSRAELLTLSSDFPYDEAFGGPRP
ncbi:MAG: sulfotransferase domain-containing protein [Myxococcales bacterium]|nr:sulfotransferase domain-containing protein [Myxococcales bacterium]